MISNVSFNNYQCKACKVSFATQRYLSIHLSKDIFCMDIVSSRNTSIMANLNYLLENNMHDLGKQFNHEMNYNIDIKSNDELNLNLADNYCNNDTQENTDTNSNNMCLESGSIWNDNYTLCLQSNLLHEIKLLKLLNNLGTPLYAYNKIMKWAFDANVSNFIFDTKNRTYYQVINYLQKLLNMEAYQPETLMVQLKGDNNKINVTVFDAPTLLASLFNDTDLNKYENLVVNKEDRYAKFESACLGEVNSGQWYKTAYDNLVKDPQNDFLCPLILASDKTTISEMGNLQVDAIFMTTSIFNTQVRNTALPFFTIINFSIVAKTRNRAIAWRVIAYIPQEKNIYSNNEIDKFDKEIKSYRLQQLYSAALKSLIDAQKPGALDAVRLQLGNHEKVVSLKIPIMFIIGDNQGGDYLCGCICHYRITAKRISRTCDAGPNELFNPKAGTCKHLHMDNVKNLLLKKIK